MDTNIKARDFTRTFQAIAQFKATEGARNGAWNVIETAEQVDAAEAADKAALQQVQDAFYQDTADINSQHDCRLVALKDIIRMTGWKTPS